RPPPRLRRPAPPPGPVPPAAAAGALRAGRTHASLRHRLSASAPTVPGKHKYLASSISASLAPPGTYSCPAQPGFHDHGSSLVPAGESARLDLGEGGLGRYSGRTPRVARVEG